jgi:hypothetical protein
MLPQLRRIEQLDGAGFSEPVAEPAAIDTAARPMREQAAALRALSE